MSRKHLVRALTVLVLAALVLPLALVGVRAAGEPGELAGSRPVVFPQDGPPPSDPWDLQITEQPPLTYPNLEYHLDELASQVESGESSSRRAASETALPLGESVLVSFWMSHNVDGVVEFLEANGGDVLSSGEDYIEAYVPVTLLGSASEQPGVLRVSEVVPAQLDQQAPPTTSQGIEVHGAANWHGLGYTGQDVKVGIIDSGFPGFRALQGSKLPETAQARCYVDDRVHTPFLSDCEGFPGHGAAVAEALVDVAPGVELYVSTPFTRVELKDAVGWMVSEGASVIVNASSWGFDGPGDGTSPFSSSPLNTVDDVVSQGGVWVNSAGNYARQTWFTERPRFGRTGLVLWDGQDDGNGMFLSAGQRILVQLRWKGKWGGASRDFDLFLGDVLAGVIVAEKRNPQTGGAGHISYEFLRFQAPYSGFYDVVAKHNQGSRAGWLQLMVWTENLQHHTKAGSVTNPSESANSGLLAVGATPWYYPHTIEPFSSRGPTPDGRDKPDVTGADCGANASYLEMTETRPGCWFAGTSQAAPHVAGLAALVRQRFPDYTPDQVAGYLKEQALPRGEVPNSTWGYGFAHLPMIVAGPGTGPTPTDPCGVAVAGDGTLSGEWAEGCQSEVSGRGYARYFSFTLAEASEVTITLESETDTFLYLREGSDRSGAALHENDDLESGNTNSRIQESLASGSYTVEATTYDEGQEDSFTLTFAGLGAAAVSPGPPAAGACVVSLGPVTGEVRQSGQWTGDCDSTNREGRHARFYTFSLSQQREVQIDLTSETDTFLYLLEGAGMDGAIEAENDDVESGNTNSRIEETLAAGAYTIEATTYDADETGSFTLVLTPR